MILITKNNTSSTDNKESFFGSTLRSNIKIKDSYQPGNEYLLFSKGVNRKDFSNWNLSHLQEMLTDRSIHKIGNKDTLVANARSSHWRCSMGKNVLRNFAKFTGKHLCQSRFFNKVAGLRPATLLKKEALAQVFSWEVCKISKNTFYTEHHWATASWMHTMLINWTLKLGLQSTWKKEWCQNGTSVKISFRE